MKHFKRERHGNVYLFKLVRTGNTVVGISAKGKVLTFSGYTDDLTDDELLTLLRQTSILSTALENKHYRSKPFYTSKRDGTGMLLIRLLPNKLEGNQYAEVELKSDHIYKGQYGDIVLWDWQDMRPVIVASDRDGGLAI